MKQLKAEMRRYSNRPRHFYFYRANYTNKKNHYDYPLIVSLRWVAIKSEVQRINRI